MCVERAKAGSPESSDSDSVDGNGPSKAPSLVPRGTDLGKRVLFYSSHDKKEKYGVLRYVGEPEFADGTWCGIELDKVDGKNNGSRHGIRYFNCEQNHGVFVPLAKVELDMSRRSRSRPNSAPSSRTPSVERTPRKPKTVAPAPGGGGGGGGGGGKPQLSSYMLQQELVNRLATPTIQKRKAAPHTPGRGGPMKAFATKGVGMESPPTTQHKKPTLAPFKSGGIQKAVSSENIRSLKEKEKRTQSGGMTGKKSSSQKDLRSSGAATTTTTSGKGISSGFQGKNRRKPVRANSQSDLFDNSTTNSGSNSKSKTSSDINFRKSADLSSLSDTHLICSWPRTSTPGNRSDQTPDGCSSPEGAELSDSRSTTSSTGETASSFSEKTDADNNTPAAQERGFIITPNGSLSTTSSSSVNGSVALDSPPSGLVTQTSQFVRSEKKSPSVEMCRVASPDGANSKQVYKNRPSGSATLPHPLTLQAAGGLTNGVSENGVEKGSSNRTLLLSPNSFKKNFLGANVTVS